MSVPNDPKHPLMTPPIVLIISYSEQIKFSVHLKVFIPQLCLALPYYVIFLENWHLASGIFLKLETYNLTLISMLNSSKIDLFVILLPQNC